ncbi:MAG: hypothetical protein LBJ89_00550 [Holosporales bacterium]|jgi:hypothetical protein|nr:hypothetical protein [Holosporales bacterium]
MLLANEKEMKKNMNVKRILLGIVALACNVKGEESHAMIPLKRVLLSPIPKYQYVAQYGNYSTHLKAQALASLKETPLSEHFSDEQMGRPEMLRLALKYRNLLFPTHKVDEACVTIFSYLMTRTLNEFADPKDIVEPGNVLAYRWTPEELIEEMKRWEVQFEQSDDGIPLGVPIRVDNNTIADLMREVGVTKRVLFPEEVKGLQLRDDSCAEKTQVYCLDHSKFFPFLTLLVAGQQTLRSLSETDMEYFYTALQNAQLNRHNPRHVDLTHFLDSMNKTFGTNFTKAKREYPNTTAVAIDAFTTGEMRPHFFDAKEGKNLANSFGVDLRWLALIWAQMEYSNKKDIALSKIRQAQHSGFDYSLIPAWLKAASQGSVEPENTSFAAILACLRLGFELGEHDTAEAMLPALQTSHAAAGQAALRQYAMAPVAKVLEDMSEETDQKIAKTAKELDQAALHPEAPRTLGSMIPLVHAEACGQQKALKHITKELVAFQTEPRWNDLDFSEIVPNEFSSIKTLAVFMGCQKAQLPYELVISTPERVMI